MDKDADSIVVDVRQTWGVPIRLVPPSILDAAANSQDRQVRLYCRPVIALLECFLRITGLSFGSRPFGPIAFERVIKVFIGAIYSKKFFSSNLHRNRRVVVVLRKIYANKKYKFPKVNLSSITQEIEDLIIKFEEIPLNPSEIYICRGWPMRNSTGKKIWAPLHSVAIKLGPEFTDKLYRVASGYIVTIRANDIPVFKDFCDFLGTHPSVTVLNLQSPGYMRMFWQEFWDYYQTKCLKSISASTLIIRWINYWAYFVKSHLIPSGIVAPLLQQSLPGPNKNSKIHARGNDCGALKVKSRLLVTVPISVTDSNAWNLLLKSVPESLALVDRWATHYADDLMARRNRRLEIANIGEVTIAGRVSGVNTGRSWKISRANPSYLANAAATYESRGHHPPINGIRLYPLPHSRTAYELGLPTKYSLLPHATLITLSDAKITSAFLSDLDLFDKHGKMVGFSEQGNVSYLIGYKHRRGPKNSLQRIKLTDSACTRVKEIISLTEPLRIALRKAGNPTWTKLFLECGKGFQVPTNPNLSTSVFLAKQDNDLANQFVEACGIDELTAKELAENFSLTNVRHTMAVRHFGETHSEEEAAKALGHAEYSESLLSRYVPMPVLSFWRERWVRSFQNGILIYAIQDDSYKSRATGLVKPGELDQFMDLDGFKSLKHVFDASQELSQKKYSHAAQKHEKDTLGKFVFNANHKNLLALHAIIKGETGSISDGEKLFWMKFASHIFNNLNERKRLDPVLAALMNTVEEQTNATQRS